MNARHLLIYVAIALCVPLGGCGAETATTAATAAKLQAERAEQARQQADKVKQDLEAANAAAADRLKEAEKAAQ